MRNTQLTTAQCLGTEAFKSGLGLAPCLNTKLMAMVSSRKIGETPKGEATTEEIFKAYTLGWNNANLYSDNNQLK